MTIIELVTKLSIFTSADDAAQVASQSGIAGSKDIYMAWGKDQNIPVKELNDAWKNAAPVTRTQSGGFAAAYYDWLAEASRSEQEAHQMILDSGSQNVINHTTHYLNIWALAETVRQGKRVIRTIGATKTAPSAPKVSAKRVKEWEYDAAHPFADEQSAKETFNKQKNFVPKKRDMTLIEQGVQCEWPIKESFVKLQATTNKALNKEV